MSALTCQRAREIVLLDIADAHTAQAARQHLLTCPQCASDTADDIETTVEQINAQRLPRQSTRKLLFIVSLIQSLIAVPWIFGVAFLWIGESETSIAHITRDGVIGFVIGVIGLAVAARPALAYFAISVCSIQVFLQVITVGFDVIDNDVSPTFELLHLLAVVILVLVVRIAFPKRK